MSESHQREAAIFDAALELPPDQRAAYLERVCGDDAALRERIEALLKVCERTSEFLDGTAPGVAAAHSLSLAGGEGQGEGAVRASFEKPGDTIGRYKLLQQIGEGGCGVVYMAEQEEPVRRRVALKVIKLGMDTKSVIARFDAERQALAMMDHPNIAKVFDAGATDCPHPQPLSHPMGEGGRRPGEGLPAGRPYFVMELVRGIKITDFCDQNNLSTAERLDLFMQVCRAIQHAHHKGIIHRDIKPSNILVTLHDGVPVPKVIDFGIAKATQGRLTNRTLFTAFEQFMGTPAYTSPEQAEMSGLDIDTRTDIYSLGVLLYELLTGKTPFDGKELLAAGLDAMRRTIREKEPARPSTRLSTMLAGELTSTATHRQTEPPKLIHLVRGDLDWIVMCCLEKDRARRYETANGLASDIQRHLKNEPVVARPPSAAYRFQKMVRRNKLAFAAVGAVAAALIIGLAVSTWLFFKERAASRRAEIEAANSGREASRARRAEEETKEALWSSYLAQAQARRFSGRMGRRFESLEALRKAAEIRPSAELRNEAIACMALPDLRLARQWELKPRDKVFMVFDSAFERYALLDDVKQTVTIHRTNGDAELMRLPGFKLPYLGALFSPNGQYLAILWGKGKANLRIWDLQRKEILLQPSARCRTVSFSSDARLVAIAFGEMNSIVIYELPSGKALNTLPQEKLPWSLAFDPSAQKLSVSSDQDENVQIRDVQTGKMIRSLAHPEPVKGVSWHPEGKFLVTACMDRNLYAWDTQTWTIQRTFKGTLNACVEVHFDHVGDFLNSCGWDGILRVWDFGTGRQVVTTPASGGRFSSDNRWVTAVLSGQKAAIWEMAKGRECRILHSSGGSRCVDFSPAQGLLASGHEDGVRIWDQSGLRQLAFVGNPYCAGVAFHPDGRSLFTATRSGLEQLAIEYQQSAHTNALVLGTPLKFGAVTKIQDLAMTLDGSKVAVVEGSSVHVFDTSTREQKQFPGQDRVWSVALSPDGNWVAATSFGREDVWVWNLQTGELEQKLPFADTTAIAFSPDGKWLVAGGSVEYRFWELPSWKLTHSIARAGVWVGITSFSSDGKILAITDQSDSVRLLDPGTGRELAALEAPYPSPIARLRLNSDGSQLAVACSAENVFHVWDLRLIQQQLAAMKLDWDAALESPIWTNLASAPSQEKAALLLFRGERLKKAGDTNGAYQALTRAIELAVSEDASETLTNALWQRSLLLHAQHKFREAASDRVRALGLPARDAATPDAAIDLSLHYNRSLRRNWRHAFYPFTNNLSSLPAGLQVFDGIRFDVRGIVQILGSELPPKENWPKEFRGIRIARDCQRLHFLHATRYGELIADGTEIGKYVIHYTDRQEHILPIRYGQDIRSWWLLPHQAAEPSAATIAWHDDNPRGPMRLFKRTWENPRPGVQVESLDFVSAMTAAAPMLMALTVD